MFEYVDIYKRPVNIGDLVLCDMGIDNQSTYTDINSTTMFQLCPDGLLRDSNGNCGDSIFISNNHKYMSVLDRQNDKNKYKVSVYKIEKSNTDIYNLFMNHRYDIKEMNRIVSNNYRVVDGSEYEATCHIDLKELFGRDLNAGDFVMYKFSKTKASYGIYYGKRVVFNEVGGQETPAMVFKITNPTASEKQIYNNLLEKFKSVSKLSTLKLNKEEPKQSCLYLNKTKKKMYLYLGKVYGNVLDCSTNQLKTIQFNKPLVIEFDLKQVKAGKLLEKFLASKPILESDIQSAYTKSAVSDFWDNLLSSDSIDFLINNFSLYCFTKRVLSLDEIPKNSFSYYLCKVDMKKLEMCEIGDKYKCFISL